MRTGGWHPSLADLMDSDVISVCAGSGGVDRPPGSILAGVFELTSVMGAALVRVRSFLEFVQQLVCVCVGGGGKYGYEQVWVGGQGLKGRGAVEGLCSQFYSVFQLQVSSLLSNVFKLLMTHKVRRPAEPSPALWSGWWGGVWGSRRVATGC